MRSSSLRLRLTIGLLLYAVVLSITLFAAGIILSEHHERLVWNDLLTDVLVRDLQAADIPIANTLTSGVQLIDLDSPAAVDAPVDIYRFTPGLYVDLERDGRQYAALVREVNGHRMAALVDTTAQQIEEGRWAMRLTLVITIGLAVFLIATWWLAGRLMQPVSCLVDRVNALDPSRRESRVATGFSQREIRALENAVNEFLQRLDGFVLREREFIDTASHELRTPITVISGAAEVLEHEIFSDESHRALRRIRDTAGDMEEMLRVLLQLAKEPSKSATVAPLALDSWLPGLVDDYRPLLQGKPLVLDLDLTEKCIVRVIPAVAAMIFGNLLRNAIEHTSAGRTAGRIRIILRDGVFSIESHSETLDAAAIARLYRAMAMAKTDRANGAGIGLYLVRRLSDRLGWPLSCEQNEAGELRVRVDLRANRLRD